MGMPARAGEMDDGVMEPISLVKRCRYFGRSSCVLAQALYRGCTIGIIFPLNPVNRLTESEGRAKADEIVLYFVQVHAASEVLFDF